MKAFVLTLAMAWLVASGVQAADQPLYQPAPAWVKPVAMPKGDVDRDGGAAQVLLQNSQTRFGGVEDEYFQETAVKIRAAQGLSDWGNVIISWRPDTETLIVHKVSILRGDQVIDLLAGGKAMQVLRRETNLEMAMLDGTLTATLQPEGLQVGDVLELAYTKRTNDPVMKGHAQDWTFLARPGAVGRSYVRAVWPKAKPIRWQANEGLGKPTTTDTAQDRELVFDLTDASAPQPPRGAPGRFGYLAQVQLTDFASWAEVSTLSAPLYAKASTLAAGSPLLAEIDRIKAASTDPEVRALAALKLVEEKVRYLYLGLNNGGYIPADADVTWTRRFGDCKAKTVLLLALLKGLGVEAQPALVNTQRGDGLDERLPTMDAFDHVGVRARIGGKSYWLDATRIGDSNLDALPTPNYHWMLPVQALGAALEKVQPPVYGEPHVELHMRLDASSGLDAAAPAHLEQVLRGDEGLDVQLKLRAMGRADLDRAMRDYWRKQAPWIESNQVTFTPDDGHGVVLTMDGSAKINWASGSNGREFFVEASNIGYDPNFQREPGPNHDAPFTVPYPFYVKQTVTVILPDKGAGFLLLNSGDINRVVAGVEYRRTARLTDGVAVIDTAAKAVAPEFPITEASAAAATLRDWSLHSVAIRFNPEQERSHADWVRCLGEDTDVAIAGCTVVIGRTTPDDVSLLDAYRRRSIAYVAKKMWVQAIADDDHVAKLAPLDPASFNDRGYAYQLSGDLRHALDDYDQSLRIKPDCRLCLTNRAQTHLALKQNDLALQDYARAIELDPKEPNGWRNRGLAYAAGRDWVHAIDDFTSALKVRPDFVDALNSRGFAYQAQHQLDLALQDFNQALRLKPDFTLALHNRAYILIMKGETSAAIVDLNRLVSLTPKDSVAYLVRGTALALHGDAGPALADFDQAISLKPDYAVAYAERGPLLIRQGRVDAGLQDMDRVVQLQPGSADALNARCWERAKLGKDLDAALSDCDAAVRLKPGAAQFLDSRCLVHLRRAEYQSAVADCDGAIRVNPKQAASLFVRGVAKRRLGRVSEGDGDIALAKLTAPKIAVDYARMGVMP